MKRFLLGAAAAVALGSCATQAPIDQMDLFAAQEIAAELSNGRLRLADAPHYVDVEIVDGPEICERRGMAYEDEACALGLFQRYRVDGSDIELGQISLLDEIDWRAPTARAFGILIHEAAHSLQDMTQPVPCLEAEAYLIQAKWLLQAGYGPEIVDPIVGRGEWEAERCREVIR